jgi:hypothetical protein
VLILLLVLILVVLTGFLWIFTLFVQGYLYTEPVAQLSWRAPAAAAALTVFFALWCLLDAGSSAASAQDVPFDALFRFSPRDDMIRREDGTPQPARRLWAVVKGVKEPVEYKLRKAGQVGQADEYVEVKTGKVWNSSARVEAVLIEEDGKKGAEKVRFEPSAGREGGYREFVSPDGWVMMEYDRGPTGQPTKFRLGRFLVNLFLNLFHLGLWFTVLWLLLRFQWGHALGFGFILWLVTTLGVLPPLLSQAAAQARPAPAGRSAALAPDCYIAVSDVAQPAAPARAIPGCHGCVSRARSPSTADTAVAPGHAALAGAAGLAA